MISLVDVHKRYLTTDRQSIWPLRGVTLDIPAKRNVAVIGASGSGRSTLLRLIAGIDLPTRGEVRCDRRVSWPIGSAAGLHGNLTGRQNARFVCRVEGYSEDEIDERLRFIQVFSELGEAFDRPISVYSATQRRQLSFSLSVAFEFDVYLIDGRTGGTGENLFREKSKNALKFLADTADLIVVARNERSAKAFCDAAIVLRDGQAYWFESVHDAWKEHRNAGAVEEAEVEE
jgi:capsular polysaccharide transport system ATP-binding protein